MALAERIWHDIGSDSGLKLVELIARCFASQQKVSRIWGETRGRATERECVLVVARKNGRPISHAPIEWTEDYKDAGPDAAHALLSARRSTASNVVD